jgi:phosphoribosylformimino-5-aminoimidazole carboxamide ribotide isomerase
VPAIDLRHGRVVRLREGRAQDETFYGDDPVAAAQDWQAQGAQRLHVVDLDGALDARPQTDIVARVIASVRIPVEVGGGIRSLDGAMRYLDCGALRVIFGTAALKQPEVVETAARRFGAAVAVAIDARDGKVAVRGWQEISGTSANDLARQVAAWGVERIQYTDVSRDGTLSGPNLATTAEVARVSGLRVTAAGGVARLDDLRNLGALLSDGVDEAIVGKALYDRVFTLSAAMRAAQEGSR